MNHLSKKEIVLITGCSGRIGFKVAEKLAPKYQIIGTDIFLVGHFFGMDLIEMDMASKQNIQESLRLIKEKFGSKIHSVIHLAAYYNFSKGHWGQYQRITVDGTQHLLDILLKEFEVEQFIFSSSMLVHAPCQKGEKIDENSPLLPKWNYPKSKVITEELIRKSLKDKIPYVLLRIAGVYDDHCHSIPLANQTQRIYENQLEAHLFPGDLSHGASFIHMDDLAQAIELLVDKQKSLPKELTLLLGEDKTISYETLQQTISQCLTGKSWKTWQVPKWFAKMGAWMKLHLPFIEKGFIEPWMVDIADDHYEIDISYAKKLLNWEPKHSLLKTIPIWIDELKREPLAWYDENRLKPSKKVLSDAEDRV